MNLWAEGGPGVRQISVLEGACNWKDVAVCVGVAGALEGALRDLKGWEDIVKNCGLFFRCLEDSEVIEDAMGRDKDI